MKSDSGGVVPEGTHVEKTWQESTADEGGGYGRAGGGNYLCGFLTPGAEDSEMPSVGLSGSSAKGGPDERNFHVQAFLILDSGVAIGEGDTVPL